MAADTILGGCAGFDDTVLRPALLPISQCPRKQPHKQCPSPAASSAQALTEVQDLLTENGTTFLVPNRLSPEETCLATACGVAVKRVKGLLAEHQASAVTTSPIS